MATFFIIIALLGGLGAGAFFIVKNNTRKAPAQTAAPIIWPTTPSGPGPCQSGENSCVGGQCYISGTGKARGVK